MLWILGGVFAILFVFPVPRRAAYLSLVFVWRLSPVLVFKLTRGAVGYGWSRGLRMAFEDLGPAYIKFGQMIASSPTAFPKEVTEEFAKCLDEVRPLSKRTVLDTIEDELERESTAVYRMIDFVPLASASIAQVHAAELLDGTAVVIKVQRPGIQRRIRQDLGLMRLLAAVSMKLVVELRRANLSAIIDDFQRTIHEEMNFRLEAANIDSFNELLEREQLTALAIAPRVYHDLTTQKVLTLQRFYGCRIDDKQGVQHRVDDVKQMLRNTSEVFWSCVFLGGFFHGDIHAGNIMVLDDGRLGYLDFGIFGRFADEDRVALADWVAALVSGNGEQMARSIKLMGAVPEDVDWPAFVQDVTQNFLPLRAITVDNMEMLEEYFPRLRDMAARHNASLPGNFVLILKQLVYFGRYVMLHAPSYNENLDPQMQQTFVRLFVKFNAWRLSRGGQAVAIQPLVPNALATAPMQRSA